MAVHVGVVRVSLRLHSRTLKEKRAIVKSVVALVQQRFHATAAEVEDLDDVSIATVAAAIVSNSPAVAEQLARAIAGAVEAARPDAELIDATIDVLRA